MGKKKDINGSNNSTSRIKSSGIKASGYVDPDDWTSEDLFNLAYSRQSHTASSQKARDERFKNELADQHAKGFTDYVVPAITNTADFIPLVGEVKSAANAVNAYIEGNPGAAALYAMGALPAAGIMSRGSSIIGKAGSKVLRKYSNGMPAVANAVAEIVNQPKKLYNAVKWAIDDIGENGMRKFSEMVPFSARSTAAADKKSAESVKAGIEWLEDYYKHPAAQEKIRKIREDGDVAYSPERMEALKKKGLLNEDGTPNYEKWMESIPVEVGGPSALMDSKVVGFHTPIESAEGAKDVIFNRMGPFYVNPDGLKYIAAHEDNHAMQEIFGLDNWEKVASGYAGANTDTKIGKMFDAVRNKATGNEWYNSPSELHSKLIEWKMKNGLNAGDEITFRHMSDLASDSSFSKFLDFDNADWGDIKKLLNALPVALPVVGVGAVGAYATPGDNNGDYMLADGGSVSGWKPSKEILDFVLETEKFRSNIYKDGNGIETIGYGFTDPKLIKKYKGKSMSRKEALRIFFNEKVPEFSRYVADSTENFDKLNDDQKDALFSYVYNIGVGKYKKNYPKLHKALKNEDWASAAFNMDAGYNDEKNKGLRDRRNYERLLFGYYSDDDGNVYPLGEYDTGVKMIQDSAHENKNILELMDPMTSTYMEAYNAAKLRGDKKFKYGKKQYPVKYDDGGTVGNPDDIASRRDNTNVANLAPQIILSDEIGGNLPYEAGVLPEVVVKSGLSGKKLERALNLAGARRGRNYVYQSQNEVMDPILDAVNSPAVQLGLSFAPIIGSAMDIQDLVKSIKEGSPEAIALASVGFIPFIGDAGKYGSKTYRKIPDKKHLYDLTPKEMEEFKSSIISNAHNYYDDIILPKYKEVINREYDQLNDREKYIFDKMASNSFDLNALDDVNTSEFTPELKKVLNMGRSYESLSNIVRRSDEILFNLEVNDIDHFVSTGNSDANAYIKNNKIHLLDELPTKRAYGSYIHELRHGSDATSAASNGYSIFLPDYVIENIDKSYKAGIGSESSKVREKIATNSKAFSHYHDALSSKLGRSATLDETREYMMDNARKRIDSGEIIDDGYLQDYVNFVRSAKNPSDYYDWTDEMLSAQYFFPASALLLGGGISSYLNSRKKDLKAASDRDVVEYDDGGTVGDNGKISMDNYDIAYDYLVNERGISPQSAIAIMANLENESGMNAGITNSIGAFGIQQWLGPRKSALLKRYGSNPNLRQQLEFLVDEYEGKGGYSGWNYPTKGKNLGTDRFNYYMYSKSDFDNAPTIEDATIAWNQGFGRPATWELNNEGRIASAKRLASRFNIPYETGSYTSGQVTPKKKENVAAFQEEVSPVVVRNPETVVLKKAKEQEPVKTEEHKSSYAKKVEEKSNKIAEQRMRDKAKMDFFNLVWNELNFRRV